MILFKKISILLLMVFVACGASEGDVEVTENISSNSSEPTTTIEQEKENDDSTTTSIKEANEESEDYSTEIVISIGEIVTDTTFRDYQKYVDVAGFRIFALPEVSDEYMYKVAETYFQMLQPGENIDSDFRLRYLNIVENEKVFQRIGFEGPEYYNFDSPNPSVDCCPGNGYEDNHTDFIWEYKDANTIGTVGEVVEHLLHTITGAGLLLEFPEWSWEDSNSRIHKAMNEAVEKNIYDISSYEEIRNNGDIEGYNRVTVQEFSFWVIVTCWGYGDIFDLPNGEFEISSINEIRSELPLAFELYVDTIEKIFTAPDKELLKSLFS
tara:strand:+ start:75 stop:1046 length:972 start_codon:yes stop_codon:yes gene_type:complete